MNAIVIPKHLHERQAAASDPARSVWVSANAGSGKTHVLTQRVMRLLLDGVPPAKILCLTFTKAAAAQMATRVFDRLSRWTALSEAELRREIAAMGKSNPSPEQLLLARRLFTRTVETPGGLKIQTIHAFCERLLHLFPFEANVPAHFEVADEVRADEMLALAKRDTITEAHRSPGELGAAVEVVADIAGMSGIDGLVAAAMRLRAPVRRMPRDLQSTLPERLGAGNLVSVRDVRRAMVKDGLAPSRWLEIAAIFERGSANDGKQAERLRAALAIYRREAATGDLSETLATYLDIFYTSGGKERANLLTKALGLAEPLVQADLDAERARLIGLRDNLRVAEAIERTSALLDLVNATAARYERAKTAGGVLDFDDLIERTLALLKRSDSRWVLHKLDAGIDHVLVDEAQDTSAAQWEILEHLTDDFAAGHGGAAMDRSFFVVGDDKQSIFSFQGAAPLMFDTMRSAFERRFKEGGKRFERVSLNTSFRSVPGILDAVDTIFEHGTHKDGLVSASDVWPRHESVKPAVPGLIEIWPAIGASEPDEPDDWTIPLDILSERDPASILADRIAQKIATMTSPNSGEWVHDSSGRKRPIKPGDIMVLVRTRNAVFEAIIRALKRHHVDVAGADRLDVANHIAVMDLVAAGRVALLPIDDLSLAALLKSPLFGLTDDDLLALAPRRKGSLIRALAQSEVEHHRSARETIRHWEARAAATTPFTFYVELLGRDGGRRRMEARLGPEAHDAIDEFLRLALAHEQQGPPSLGAFLDDVEALESSIRRDLEGPGDMVRVMTVHAAKGLEAKVVFLPDTCGVPDQRLDTRIFDLNKDTGRAPVLVWSPHKDDDPPPVAKARTDEREATMREYRRLLYVALTRAEERLYIAGFYKSRKPTDECWSQMIQRAFPGALEVPAPWNPEESVLRIRSDGEDTAPPAAKTLYRQGAMHQGPPWLFQPVADMAPAAHLRPSQRARDPGPGRKQRIAYGSAVHLLLQHLAGRAAADREAIGRRLLAVRARDLDVARHGEALAEALAVMALPDLAALFAPEARAEVPVVGHAARPDGSVHEVNGIVDRLVVTADAVLVADFKSGTSSPQLRDHYLRQLALYRDVLAPLWPSKRITMLLVWTSVLQVVVVPREAPTAQPAAP